VGVLGPILNDLYRTNGLVRGRVKSIRNTPLGGISISLRALKKGEIETNPFLFNTHTTPQPHKVGRDC
jgi:hypothetical protein